MGCVGYVKEMYNLIVLRLADGFKINKIQKNYKYGSAVREYGVQRD